MVVWSNCRNQTPQINRRCSFERRAARSMPDQACLRDAKGPDGTLNQSHRPGPRYNQDQAGQSDLQFQAPGLVRASGRGGLISRLQRHVSANRSPIVLPTPPPPLQLTELVQPVHACTCKWRCSILSPWSPRPASAATTRSAPSDPAPGFFKRWHATLGKNSNNQPNQPSHLGDTPDPSVAEMSDT